MTRLLAYTEVGKITLWQYVLIGSLGFIATKTQFYVAAHNTSKAKVISERYTRFLKLAITHASTIQSE